ncbi:MAG TPA: hypothetical protein VK485_08955 [Sphingomicrobium sp.]|nr:hypothetical protein [Sphingomicrobium sp.]
MAKGNLYQVNVTARDAPNNGVKFSMQSSLLSNDRLKFYKNSNNMKADDFYLLDFCLDDKTDAKDLQFVSDLNEVLWTKTTADPKECLSSRPGTSYNEFRAIAVPTPTNLLVVNDDSHTQLFTFALNFVRGGADDTDPANFITYDPIGDNKNGGITFQSSATALTLLVLAITATAVSVAAINGGW